MRSVAIGYYIGITLLVLGLAGAFVLLTGIVRPVAEAIQVDAPLAQDCPSGDRAPICFMFDIRNTTDAQLSIGCLVVPAEGTTATFETGATTAVTLPAGASMTLRTSVDTAGGDEVAAPSLECSTVDG